MTISLGFVTTLYATNEAMVDLAIASRDSLRSSFAIETLSVVNSCPQNCRQVQALRERYDQWLENPTNSLARAWNKGIEVMLAGGVRYVICMGFDVLLRESTVDSLVRAAERFPRDLIWSVKTLEPGMSALDRTSEFAERDPGPANFDCFMVDERLFSMVGKFDELFAPAYFEDDDMRHRVRLAGGSTRQVEEARCFHYRSMSLRLEDLSIQERDAQFRRNARRYWAKWGGMPGRERFSTPYGQKLLGAS